jgi:ATP-dependent DNA helicase RecG
MPAPTRSPTSLALTSPIEAVRGVGPQRGEAFRRLGIPSVAHLVDHLPHRHEFEQGEDRVENLVVGQVGTASGNISAARLVAHGRKRFEAVLMDDAGGRLDLTWFGATYLSRKITPGTRLRVTGKLQRRGPLIQMVNPGWEFAEQAATGSPESRYRPVYPASEDLPSAAIERAVSAALPHVLDQLIDHLDNAFLAERALPSLRDAYRMLHRVEDSGVDKLKAEAEVREARRRLTYDELLLLQLGVCMRKAHLQQTLKAPKLPWSKEIDTRIRSRIPFTLTDGQEAVVREIASDLQRPFPANRLIQGDVGAGKTVVALYGMLMAVAAGHQAAMLAPTEVLAEQHFGSLCSMLSGSRVRIELLTGSISAPDRAAIQSRLAAGEIDIIVGTHALLTGSVRFDKLAIAVIDEQHRFGVEQRAALRGKAGGENSMPHTIVMTATPIPRTLSMTVFGDLDTSMLTGRPGGRSPVTTHWVVPSQSDEVYASMRARLDRGQQAFVVLPVIDGTDDEEGLRSVRSTIARLSEGPLKGKRIGEMHGQMKRPERELVMADFRAGRLDVLVATTVIEVGVDVPNATMMVIDHAERFGLAQLHQLRGRVGRGDEPGVCVLIGTAVTDEAAQRLRTIAAVTDGFRLAEEDLKLRGMGDIFGVRQSGVNPFRLARFPEDTDLLLMARRDAIAWIERSPLLDAPQEQLLRKRLLKRHGEMLGLGDVA